MNFSNLYQKLWLVQLEMKTVSNLALAKKGFAKFWHHLMWKHFVDMWNPFISLSRVLKKFALEQ